MPRHRKSRKACPCKRRYRVKYHAKGRKYRYVKRCVKHAKKYKRVYGKTYCGAARGKR